MLFKRRVTQTLWQKARNIIWPTMGFKRLMNYYKHRSIRIPASDESIAVGLAFGCLVSWTPLFGTHLIQCVVFAWVTRTNLIAGLLGTVFGNMLTTPFLMLIAYHAGKIILTILGFENLLVEHQIDAVTMESLEKNKIFLPTLIGGYAVGILTFPFFYYPFLYMVRSARAARRKRIEQKIHRQAIEVTGQQQ